MSASRRKRPDVSTMQYNLLAKLCECRNIIIPDWREIHRNSEDWKKSQLKGIDCSKVSGRLKYYRISKGVSAWELDKHLGFSKGTYHRGFENLGREPSDPDKVKQICEYLDVDPKMVFDDYLHFLNSDVAAAFLTARKKLAYTQREMAERIGVDRSVYRDWEKGKKLPNRTSFRKIQRFFGEMGCLL